MQAFTFLHPPHCFRRPPSSSHKSHRPLYATSRSALQSWLALLFSLLIYLLLRHPLPPRISLPPSIPQPTLHIFTAPKPFAGTDSIHQLAALRSWLALSPRPLITLLGDAEGYDHIARQFGLQRIRTIDTNFLGVPLFNSLISATNATKASISVLLNADVQLHDDFPYALRKITRDFPPSWLAVGARWDIPSLKNNHQQAAAYVRSNGVLHTYGGIDVWAWDTASGPLITFPVPHFVYGRGKYDNWLTHHAIQERKRVVVDISEACTFVHVHHDHHLVAYPTGPTGPTHSNPSPNLQFWSSDSRAKFELYVNSYLAASHGSYKTQDGTILHAPLKLSSCYEKEGMCIFHRKRPHACRCEYSPFVSAAQNDPYVVQDSRVVFCGLLSANHGVEQGDPRDRWAISGSIPAEPGGKKDVTFGLPLTRDHVFTVIADRTNSNAVVMVVAEFSDRFILMELVCSMRAVGLFPWLVVVALDDTLYKFALIRGLAVYLSECEDGQFGSSANCKDLVRYQAITESLRKGTAVYSVDVGSRFESSPWNRFARELDDSVDLGVPSQWIATESGKPTSPALVYVKASLKTVSLFESIVTQLKGRKAADNFIMRTLSCDADSASRLGGTRCRLKNGLILRILDESHVRAMERHSVLYNMRRSRPVMYFTDLKRGAERFAQVLKAGFMLRHDRATGLCVYTKS